MDFDAVYFDSGGRRGDVFVLDVADFAAANVVIAINFRGGRRRYASECRFLFCFSLFNFVIAV